ERGRMLADLVRLDNPMDLTGLVFGEHRILTDALAAFADDPGIAMVACVQTILPSPEQILGGRPFLEATARGLRELGKPGALVSATREAVRAGTLELVREVGVPLISGAGINLTLDAIANVRRWSAAVREQEGRHGDAAPARDVVLPESPRRGTWSEL